MTRLCKHRFLLVDSFIEGGGAFVSCLTCPRALELPTAMVERMKAFEHTSSEGPERDLIVLIDEELF